MKKISLFLFYLISFIYMEVVYKIFSYNHFFKLSLINTLLFVLGFSILLTIITKLFKNNKINKGIFISLMFIITIWFSAQFVVKNYFDFYLSLSTFSVADQIADGFIFKAFIETIKRMPEIILLFIPFILSIKLINGIDLEKQNKYGFLSNTLLLFIFIGSYLISLFIGKDASYSAYKLNYDVNDVSLNMENLGVLNTFKLDIERSIFGFKDKIEIVKEMEEIEKIEEEVKLPKEYDYNNLDIDFDSLMINEKNKNVNTIHEYMKNSSGTKKNEYTGVFKDKNLILFMAESFNEIAVDENLTPTLYKLVNSGFVFENFYTPTIYSTIGGEFQEMTGLYAQSTTILKTFRDGNIYFPYGIANTFKDIDYTTYAYHNNSYQFQDRYKYLKSLGFDNFKACYNGLEKLINCKSWPQSDVDMINATIDDYINDDHFMVFYATVSGHSSYNFSAHSQAKKHKDEYMSYNYSYSEAPAAYLASQMELDKALEELLKKLEENGKLDNTVIALVGDHYPYELTMNEVNEISKYKKDEVVTVNKSNFILWNNTLDTVKVSKVGSQLDVIPTIYNAFGIEYDSRLFMGNDILSTSPGLAIFANRSWASDKGIYYAARKEFVPNEGVSYDDDYINTVNQIVNNRITMSKMIIENNYYKKVFENN